MHRTASRVTLKSASAARTLGLAIAKDPGDAPSGNPATLANINAKWVLRRIATTTQGIEPLCQTRAFFVARGR
jgi:hypothetical protein